MSLCWSQTSSHPHIMCCDRQSNPISSSTSLTSSNYKPPSAQMASGSEGEGIEPGGKETLCGGRPQHGDMWISRERGRTLSKEEAQEQKRIKRRPDEGSSLSKPVAPRSSLMSEQSSDHSLVVCYVLHRWGALQDTDEAAREKPMQEALCPKGQPSAPLYEHSA